MSEFSGWWKQQPFNSKWLTIVSLVFPVLVKFRLLNPYWLVWDYYSIVYKFQYWRVLTPFFIKGVDFSLLISLYVRFRYASYLEEGKFFGREADFTFFLLISIFLINILNSFVGLVVLWEPLSLAVVHYWAQLNKNVTVSFMFGIKFPAIYLPLVMGLMTFLFTADFWGPLFGIIAGHVFYFFSEIYVKIDPRWSNRLKAPWWMNRIVGKSNRSTLKNRGYSVHAPKDRVATSSTSNFHFSAFSGKSTKLGS